MARAALPVARALALQSTVRDSKRPMPTTARPSKLRRSLERGGPLGIALALGVFLVGSSALSYRDARRTAGIVAERQGIGLIRRIEAGAGHQRDAAALSKTARAALEANRGLGLTYVGFFERAPDRSVGALIAEAGRAVMPDAAPGRFAACINQAPLRRRTHHPWLRPYDMALNLARTWRIRSIPPDHLLRNVFETCVDYSEAKHRLETTPLARPAIYSLVGCAAGERCVIERTEEGFTTRGDNTSAANDWFEGKPSWEARPGSGDARLAIRSGFAPCDVRASSTSRCTATR